MPKKHRKLPFYVIGHRNPDTDAICSAIGQAEFLRRMGEEDVQAARCGVIAERTAWVLEQAQVEEPVLVTDVRATAGMICEREVITVRTVDTFLEAYRKMVGQGVRSVPVLGEGKQVEGMLRYLDLLELLLPGDGDDMVTRTVRVSLSKIAETLQAQVEAAELSDESKDLIMLVGASSQNNVERRLKLAKKEGNVDRYIVICGDRPVIQHMALRYGVAALLITGDNTLDSSLRELAQEKSIPVLLCAQDTASCTTLIRCSRTVEQVMEQEFITVGTGELVIDLRRSLAQSKNNLFPVVSGKKKKLIGVISKSDLIDPPQVRLSLVDHNEFSQAVKGIEEAQIIEVTDHHRISGDLATREPVRFLNEPVGSTSTLVARKFRHRGMEPSRGVALCLCAGLVSDTLCLTSPTATELDREILEWLSELAGIDPQKFTQDFFKVGSLLRNGSVTEALNADRKEFSEDDVKVTIAQLEELGLEFFEQRRDELEQGLQQLVEQEKYELAVLAVTDISNHYSMILVAGNEQVIRAIPFPKIDDTLFEASGVVSRKKQIFPSIALAIRQSR